MTHGCPRPVHIFDVCGTLFRQDTTLGLLRWHAWRRRKYLAYSLLALLLSSRSPLFWTLKMLEKLSGRHLAKHVGLATLAGESIGEVHYSAHQYVTSLLAHDSIEPIHQLLSRAREDGQVVLASASMNPVIEALCQCLALEGVSSILEVKQGRCTGRLALDLSGRKIEALQERFGKDVLQRESSCYTDNLSDKGLLAACKYRTVVLHGKHRRQRWDFEDATYIVLK